MEPYSLPIQIRWADMDLNGHLRHSAYLDYGALLRTRFLTDHDLPTKKLLDHQIGPIVFREEVFYKREIRMEDKIIGTQILTRARSDYSRWSMQHELIKADGTIAAVINLDGAWLDLSKRKLTTPPSFVQEAFNLMQRSSDFVFE